MKRILLIAIFLAPLLLRAQESKVFAEGLKFAEGTIAYKNHILVSNFGCDSLRPINSEGKGYIASIDGDELTVLIPASGALSAPKGMAVLDHHLFVADVGRVVVFNLKRPRDKPRVIKFADEDLFVNDLVAVGSIILASVTNTGRIYGIDASDINNLGSVKLMGNVPGANGLALSGGRLFIASYDPNEKPSEVNVIYSCDIAKGDTEPKPLIPGLPAGQYDGVAVSEDGSRLYFTSWTGKSGGAVYSYALSGTEPVRTLDFGVKLTGPADITIKDGMIYIPDLPESKIYRFQL